MAENKLNEQKLITILPALKKDHNIGSLDTPGSWYKDNNDSFIDMLAEGLDFPKRHTNKQQDLAVPDVWAHVEVYKTALIDKNHPIHERAVQSWRGLLAILGLKAYHNLDVEIKAISLEKLAENPFNYELQKENRANFAEVLRTILPYESLIGQEHWEELGIILYNGNPIGILSPSTLVCPTCGNGISIDRLVSWQYNKQLLDPCKCDHLTPPEFGVLAFYLDNLHQEFKEKSKSDKIQTNFNGELLQPITEQLISFRTDALEEMKKRDKKKINWEIYAYFPEITHTTIIFTKHPIYSNLVKSPLINNFADQTCQSHIKSRPEFTGDFNAVITDTMLADTWKAETSEITIWNQYSLEHIHRLGEIELKWVKNEMLREGLLLLNAENFFTDYLIEIVDSEIRGHKIDFIKHLIPLRPLSLLFFDKEYLNENLFMNENKTNYEVSLRIKFDNDGGNQSDYIFVKKYDKNKIIKTKSPLTINAWPDFKSELWNNYYLYYVGNGNKRQLFNITPFYPELIKKNLDKLILEKGNYEFLLSDEFNYIDKIGNIVKQTFVEGENVREIQWMDSAPEALICKAKDSNESKRILQGIMLLPEPKKINTVQSKWSVGLDFGTTNTSIYVLEKGRNPEPITFKPRYMNPLSKLDYIAQSSLEQGLIPPREIHIPFLSMLMDRRITGNFKPLLTSRVNYIPDAFDAIHNMMDNKLGKEKIYFKLKWSNDKEDRKRTKLYLEQVTLQTMAEIMISGAHPNDVQWCYSYPKSFSNEQINAFKDILIQSLQNAIGKNINDYDGKYMPDVVLKSESLAASLYFQNKFPIAFNGTAIVIDIGGTSTDVAIWHNRKLLWHNSFILGGRNLLTAYLRNDLKMLDELFSAIGKPPTILESLKMLKDDKDLMEYGLEILVNNPIMQQEFNNGFPTISGLAVVRAFKIMAELALAGIFYYLGHVMSYLSINNNFTPNTAPLNVFLGGQGSKIYRNMGLDLDLITSFLNEPYENKKNINSFFSPKFKHEVSSGLLTEFSVNKDLDEKDNSNRIIWGDEIFIDDVPRKPDQAVENVDITGTWTIKDTPQFKNFIDRYNT